VKPNLIRNLIFCTLLALAVAGWTAFGVCLGNRKACEKDEITVECNCTHDITVECNAKPKITVECNCPPTTIIIDVTVECNCTPIIVVECDCEPCEGCCDCEPCDCDDEPEPVLEVTDVQARVSIDNNVATLVIDILYDDGSTEQIIIDLVNGVVVIETYGDFTVEAMYSVSGFNITSYATVTKN